VRVTHRGPANTVGARTTTSAAHTAGDEVRLAEPGSRTRSIDEPLGDGVVRHVEGELLSVQQATSSSRSANRRRMSSRRCSTLTASSFAATMATGGNDRSEWVRARSAGCRSSTQVSAHRCGRSTTSTGSTAVTAVRRARRARASGNADIQRATAPDHPPLLPGTPRRVTQAERPDDPPAPPALPSPPREIGLLRDGSPATPEVAVSLSCQSMTIGDQCSCALPQQLLIRPEFAFV
jgi:hypothetical protein